MATTCSCTTRYHETDCIFSKRDRLVCMLEEARSWAEILLKLDGLPRDGVADFLGRLQETITECRSKA